MNDVTQPQHDGIQPYPPGVCLLIIGIASAILWAAIAFACVLLGQGF